MKLEIVPEFGITVQDRVKILAVEAEFYRAFFSYNLKKVHYILFINFYLNTRIHFRTSFLDVTMNRGKFQTLLL